MRPARFSLFPVAILLLAGLAACAKEANPTSPAKEHIHIAVASNFAPTLAALVELFTDASEVEVLVSVGSTGKHAVQIRQGAPFDIYLAADQEHPLLLEQEGHGIVGSRQAYAVGRLMLWSLDPKRVVDASSLYPSADQDRGATLAIANPDHAPYGAAAQQFLEAQGLWEDYPGLRVMGENVGQAYRFARSGNAAMALVARSQVVADALAGGHGWLVPDTTHDPIVQEVLLLQETPAARAFLTFLRSDAARSLIQEHGYALPEMP